MTKTILCVDDSASIRQMVKLTLSGAGYQVIQANDGAEGLAKARESAVHLVVTDLNMPIMNGLGLIRELRKLPAYKGVPIIFLTTESDPAIKQEAKTRRRYRMDHQTVSAGTTGWRRTQGNRHMSGTEATETFRQEAQELLETLEQALLDLEHTPGDMDLVDSAFRALHTIKGSGAMFGFDAVAGFTHHVETAFDLVRKGKVTASPN